MAPSLLSVLESMQRKIEALSVSVDDLRGQNRRLEEENQELRRNIRTVEADRDKARLEAEFLAVSHRLAEDPDTIVDARRLIARLIRNIDRCIEMLKE